MPTISERMKMRSDTMSSVGTLRQTNGINFGPDRTCFRMNVVVGLRLDGYPSVEISVKYILERTCRLNRGPDRVGLTSAMLNKIDKNILF